MKSFDLSMHSFFQAHVIQGAAHDAEALPSWVVTYAPQLVLGALVHDAQLMDQTRALVEKEWKSRSSSASILLNKIVLVGVESWLEFEQELFVNYLQALQLPFPLYIRKALKVSCKMLYIHILKVLFKAWLIKVKIKVQRISTFTKLIKMNQLTCPNWWLSIWMFYHQSSAATHCTSYWGTWWVLVSSAVQEAFPTVRSAWIRLDLHPCSSRTKLWFAGSHCCRPNHAFLGPRWSRSPPESPEEDSGPLWSSAWKGRQRNGRGH